jgi:salicylate hydroxylase
VPTATEMRLFSTGQSWRAQDLGADAVARYGSPYWLVHRGGATAHWSQVAAPAERAPGAVHVGAPLRTGCGWRDAVAGRRRTRARRYADRRHGVNSQIRETLFGGARATFTGFMAWRAVVPMDRLPARLRQRHGMAWIGPHGHA